MDDPRRSAPVRSWPARRSRLAISSLPLVMIAAASCGGGQAPSASVDGAPPHTEEVQQANAETAQQAPQDLWGPTEILALIEHSAVEYVVTSRPTLAAVPLKAAGASSQL